MPTNTTTYSFQKPVVGADEDSWGGYLNSNWDKVDDLFDGTVAITGIDINSGTIDGTVIGGSSAAAITGTTGQFNTSLNVDGTLTSDGLTVDGTGTAIDLRSNNNGGTALNTLRFTDTDVTAVNNAEIGKIEFYATDTAAVVASIAGRNADASPDGYLQFNTAEGTTLRSRMVIKNNGDISFYDAAGVSQSLFWDASAESLGIGTSSPSAISGGIHAVHNSTEGTPATIGDELGIFQRNFNSAQSAAISIISGSASTSNIYFGDNGDIDAGKLSWSNSSNSFSFSGGSVGIGTSSPSEDLHVTNSTGSSAIKVSAYSSGNNDAKLILDGNGTGLCKIEADKSLTFSTDGGSSEAMRLESDGDIAFGNAGSNNYSWMRPYETTTGNLIISSDQGATGVGGSNIVFRTRGADKMVIQHSGNVGIGTSSPTEDLHVSGTADQTIAVESTSTGAGANAGLKILAADGGDFLWQTGNATGNALRLYDLNASAERMRIDSSGNLLVGTTSTATNDVGFKVFQSTGQTVTTASGTNPVLFNRKTSDGDIAIFRKDDVTVGSIASISYGMQIYATGVNNTGWTFGDGSAVLPMKNSALSDNFVDLGSASYRMDDIYATNGTIQTSDANEKQDIDVLSDAEQRVALAAKGLLRKFRWKDAVAEKGDDARIHFGIIAQDLQAAFAAEGLDAGDYAMFIHSTWTDEETGEEKSRMGVRYSELLAFIIAAI